MIVPVSDKSTELLEDPKSNSNDGGLVNLLFAACSFKLREANKNKPAKVCETCA
jgi:hypothetical protein